MEKRQRIVRSEKELLQALHAHIELLREYYKKAFEDNDPRYLGEVAGKLRLLIYPKGANRPLLSDMMKKLNVEIRLDMIGPGFPNGANIDEFFNHVGGIIPASDGHRVEVTPMMVVATWAQQMGASHEDPSLDADFADLINEGLFVNNRQIAADELRRATRFVLLTADFFFEDMGKMGKWPT